MAADVRLVALKIEEDSRYYFVRSPKVKAKDGGGVWPPYCCWSPGGGNPKNNPAVCVTGQETGIVGREADSMYRG